MRTTLGLLILVMPLLAGADMVAAIDTVGTYVKIRKSPEKGAEAVGRLHRSKPRPHVASVPGWHEVRATVRDARYGAVRSASFQRLGSMPAWSRDFYADRKKSGGALVDLHIHDADFIRWCFGPPDGVTSAGTVNHLTALYRYSGGPAHVAAEGGWDHTPGFGFQMRYIVVFERATAEFLAARLSGRRAETGTRGVPSAS